MSHYDALKLAVAEMDPNPWHPADVRAVNRAADGLMADCARLERDVVAALAVPVWRWRKRERMLREAVRVRKVPPVHWSLAARVGGLPPTTERQPVRYLQGS